MNPVELAAQIRQTRAFIDANPLTVVLTPHTREADGSGGRKLVAGEPRQPQTVRIMETASTRMAARPTEVGEGYQQEATLLALPDAVVEVNDMFPYSGGTWRVIELLLPIGYEIRAVVVRHGR